jgi:hypothetical protein
MVQRLRGHVDAVYDMTIAYPDGLPQSELDLVKGCFPKEIHVHTKVPRFATEEKKIRFLPVVELETTWSVCKSSPHQIATRVSL